MTIGVCAVLFASCSPWSPQARYVFYVSTIEEIEQAVEKLPLAVWVNQRRLQLQIPQECRGKNAAVIRDHSAFLNSYSLQDEGLYDDTATS
ncbi:MAG TPA: hypothetical protein VGV18_10625 [Verrucomicrobiae bacterium]|nr:hypothetical protein [Verrucomicrobiae bacterium]